MLNLQFSFLSNKTSSSNQNWTIKTVKEVSQKVFSRKSRLKYIQVLKKVWVSADIKIRGKIFNSTQTTPHSEKIPFFCTQQNSQIKQNKNIIFSWKQMQKSMVQNQDFSGSDFIMSRFIFLGLQVVSMSRLYFVTLAVTWRSPFKGFIIRVSPKTRS